MSDIGSRKISYRINIQFNKDSISNVRANITQRQEPLEDQNKRRAILAFLQFHIVIDIFIISYVTYTHKIKR